MWAILLTIDDADAQLSLGKVARAKVAMAVPTDLEILERLQEKFLRRGFMAPLATLDVAISWERQPTQDIGERFSL